MLAAHRLHGTDLRRHRHPRLRVPGELASRENVERERVADLIRMKPGFPNRPFQLVGAQQFHRPYVEPMIARAGPSRPAARHLCPPLDQQALDSVTGQERCHGQAAEAPADDQDWCAVVHDCFPVRINFSAC